MDEMLCRRADSVTITPMRLTACSLLALAGCNAIFGLNDNAKLGDPDGPPLPDGPLETFKLRFLVADTEPLVSGGLGEPKALFTAGMADVSGVQVGPIDGELRDAPYDQATGEVGIPFADLTSARWRARYTFDGVLHEVQWQPALQDAKLVEARLGHLEVVAPPADSGYNIQPTGAGTPPIGGYIGSRVYTTGAFLDIRTGTSPSSTRVDDPANIVVGAIGSPDMALGDNVTLVNYAVPSGACAATVNGYAHFRPPALAAGTKLLVNPTWRTSPTAALSVTYLNQGAPNVLVRMAAALADSTGTRSLTQAGAVEHGITASAELTGTVIERPVTLGGIPVAVPGPHMLLLAQCNLGTTGFNPFLSPIELAPFPRVTHAMFTDRRLAGTATLVSSLVSVDRVQNGNASTADFRAPLAIDPITLTDGVTVFSLSGGSDGVALGSVAAPLSLSFTLEADQAQVTTAADYFEVTVLQIQGTAVIPKRTFVTAEVAAPIAAPRTIDSPIPIDLSGLTPGTYVLRIRTIAGAPRAALGDFEAVSYPYSAASVFTRTFVIP